MVEGSGRFVGDRASSSQQNAAAQAEEGVTLNLVNVPVQQAANTILADILGVKYTFDPKIDGRVTIQTPAPVARSAAIDLFQSALRANNAAIVSAGGLYRIVSLDQAPVGAVIQTASLPAASVALGSSLQVMQLQRRRQAFLRKWRLKHRAVADSLEEAGDRLFTFTRLPPSRWPT